MKVGSPDWTNLTGTYTSAWARSWYYTARRICGGRLRQFDTATIGLQTRSSVVLLPWCGEVYLRAEPILQQEWPKGESQREEGCLRSATASWSLQPPQFV